MVNAEYYEKQVARIGKRLKAARAEYMKEYWHGELAKMCAAQQTYALDVCPECFGDGSRPSSIGRVFCDACNGTGKRQ